MTAPDNNRIEWDRLLAAYRAAKAAEDQYEIDSGIADAVARDELSSVSRSTWQEVERLQNLRWDAEEPLMDHPAPDLEAFAIKFLIAHADDRDANGWNGMLEAEAKRFVSLDAAA